MKTIILIIAIIYSCLMIFFVKKDMGINSLQYYKKVSKKNKK